MAWAMWHSVETEGVSGFPDPHIPYASSPGRDVMAQEGTALQVPCYLQPKERSMNVKEMADLIASLSNELVQETERQVSKGNQAAARRARKASSKIGKLCKEFRKASLGK